MTVSHRPNAELFTPICFLTQLPWDIVEIRQVPLTLLTPGQRAGVPVQILLQKRKYATPQVFRKLLPISLCVCLVCAA